MNRLEMAMAMAMAMARRLGRHGGQTKKRLRQKQETTSSFCHYSMAILNGLFGSH